MYEIIMLSIFFFPFLAYGVLCYVFQALGLSRMLTKVGYEKPYYAWIPFANILAMGRLAEEYDNEKPRENIGMQLLSVYIVMSAMFFLVIISIILMAIGLNEDIEAFVGIFIMIPAFIIVYIFAIKCTIRQYLALWKILRMFNPDAAVGLLMLCIFLPALPFVFISISKNEPQNLRRENDSAGFDAYQAPAYPYYPPYPQQQQILQYPQQLPQTPQYPEQNQNPPENPYKY